MTVYIQLYRRADGGTPYSGVIRDAAGNFYGTTYFGGAANFGVVYKLDAAGHQTVLHSFMSGADGQYPRAGVIRDAAGNLYGTTEAGGSACCRGVGMVYKLDPPATRPCCIVSEPMDRFPAV